MVRVAESHAPLLVNIGVRSWNASKVPVGRRLARLAAVLVKVCVARRCIDSWRTGGFFGVSGSALMPLGTLEVGAVTAFVSFTDGCFLATDLVLTVDIVNQRLWGKPWWLSGERGGGGNSLADDINPSAMEELEGGC